MGNEHMYDGTPDARQAVENVPTSRFRPRYRALEPDEIALHDAIKNKAAELEELFGRLRPGRYHSLAVTALEQAVMWIVKELTDNA